MATETLQRTAYILLIIVLGVVVLHYGQAFIFLLLFPAMLSFLLLPLSRRLESAGLGKGVSATLSMLLMVAMIGGVMTILGSQFMSFQEDIPRLQAQVDQRVKSTLGWVEEEFELTSKDQLDLLQSQITSLSKSGTKILVDLFSWTGSFISNLLLMMIILFLMLLLRSRFKEFLKRLSKGRDIPFLQIVDDISALSLKYSKGVALVIVILAALNSIGFLAIGLKHAVLLGITSALLTIIPYVGTLIGGLLPLTVALLTKDSWVYPVAVMGIVGLSQFLEGNFITPKVVGSSVSLNPLASILALVAGGMLWGIAGMILAIPLMGMIKVVCDAVPGLEPYGYLIGESGGADVSNKSSEKSSP